MDTLLIALNAKYSHTNPAVRYLRHALCSAGIAVEIAEFTINQPPREILTALAARVGESGAPRFLFSCYIWNITMVRQLGSDLRTLYPDCTIVLGGPEVGLDADSLPEQGFSFADAVVCGEGETVLPELLRTDRPHGVHTSDLPVDLDTLPFPYDDLALLQHRVIYYESSRGCPFRCAYCLSGGETRVRERSLPLVFDDLQRLLDARVMQVKFVDRTFNVQAARAEAIWSFLCEQDNGVTSFQMEVGGDLLTPGQIAVLNSARPGLFQLEVGVQSTCEAALLASCRQCDFARLSENVRALRAENRVHLHLDLIAGLPEEGFERFLCSFDEVFALTPHQLQLGFLKLLRGAPLYQKREQYQLLHSSYPPYEVLSTGALSFAEICRLRQMEEVVEIYYNSGRFSALLDDLLGREPSPARFFLALATFLPAQKPAKYDYYDYLFRFGRQRGGNEVRMAWLMRYDLCRHERPRRLPEHAAKALGREHGALPTHDDPAVHMELFPFDPAGGADAPVALAFDYRERDFCGRAAVTRV